MPPLMRESLGSWVSRSGLPSSKLTQQWNISIFNRKYIFIQGPFSMAMLVYWSVILGKTSSQWSHKRLITDHGSFCIHACVQVLTSPPTKNTQPSLAQKSFTGPKKTTTASPKSYQKTGSKTCKCSLMVSKNNCNISQKTNWIK